MRLLLILAALPLWGANDANEIVKRMIEADKKNWDVGKQYTFVEQADHFSLEKNGSWKKFNSETIEVMFVEGAQYKRLIARNDKPLDAKEEAREKKKLQQTAEERRKANRSTLTHKVVNLGSYDDLLTLFDNSVLSEEEIRGRKAWVILSKPKDGRVPANDHEKEVLSFEKKLWIDEEENQIVRSLSTVVGKHITFMPGSTILFDFEKVNGEAWLETSGVLDGHLQFAKMIKPAVRTEYKYTKFQKFDVKSTITVEP
jgi:hypothetical protein